LNDDEHHATADEITAAATEVTTEILDDIEAGVVPATVDDFSALHDYVDANTQLRVDDRTWTSRVAFRRVPAGAGPFGWDTRTGREF
jgi:hypothetical protein